MRGGGGGGIPLVYNDFSFSDVYVENGAITLAANSGYPSFTREREREREREMFYLTTHSTHFIYGYMASDIWLRTILIVRKETRCRHIGYSF